MGLYIQDFSDDTEEYYFVVHDNGDVEDFFSYDKVVEYLKNYFIKDQRK